MQTCCALISHLTLVLAFMISLADYASVAVFIGSSPSLLVITYLWMVVYSCSQSIKKEEIRCSIFLVLFFWFQHSVSAPEARRLRQWEVSQPLTPASPR